MVLTAAMDEEAPRGEVSTVGEQLRSARKKKKLSLDDIAAQTRIPLRHLESLENSDWENLPAPTYSVGFAKSYASVVGLDRQEIGDKLRAEIGGFSAVTSAPAEVFEPVDPARAMPKWLVIGGILAVLLVVLGLRWLSNRELYGSSDEQAVPSAPAAAPATAPSAAPPVAQSPVVISATEPVWISVYDKGGTNYFSGMLNPGSNYQVPASAPAPLLKTGKPEALKIMVGATPAPAVGPAGKMTSDVSLLPADLLKGGSAAAPPQAAARSKPTAAPAPARQKIAPPRKPAPKPVAPAAGTQPPAEPTPAPLPPPGNTTG